MHVVRKVLLAALLVANSMGCVTVGGITGKPGSTQGLTWRSGVPILRATGGSCELTMAPFLTTGSNFIIAETTRFQLNARNTSNADIEMSEKSISAKVSNVPAQITPARKLEQQLQKYESLLYSTGAVVTTSDSKDAPDGTGSRKSTSREKLLGPVRRTTLAPGSESLEAYFVVENNRMENCGVPDKRGRGYGRAFGPCTYAISVACGEDRETFVFAEEF